MHHRRLVIDEAIVILRMHRTQRNLQNSKATTQACKITGVKSGKEHMRETHHESKATKEKNKNKNDIPSHHQTVAASCNRNKGEQAYQIFHHSWMSAMYVLSSAKLTEIARSKRINELLFRQQQCMADSTSDLEE